MAKEDDGSFDRDGRKMLLQLAEEPETEEVWTQIVKSCGERGALFVDCLLGKLARIETLLRSLDIGPTIEKRLDMPKLLLNS
jgi:hypothetical protein